MDRYNGSVAEMAGQQPSSGGRGFDPYLLLPPCDFGPKQFGWLINQLGKPLMDMEVSAVLVGRGYLPAVPSRRGRMNSVLNSLVG